MKLATLKGGRDGRLVVVSRDLSTAVSASSVAATLMEALERWDEVLPGLEDLSQALNAGSAAGAFPFNPRDCHSPLPRANTWLDASTFSAHGNLMKQSLKLERQPSADFPLILQANPSDMMGPYDDEPVPSEEVDIDFEAEIAIITGALRARPTLEEARAAIKLVILVNDWSLRALAPPEIASGFGFLRSKAPTSFGPVAVTLDELGDAWKDNRLNMAVRVEYNGKPWGHPNAYGMDYGFDELVADAATNRRLLPATIIASGTVSEGDPGRVGSSCIAEVRGHEIITTGKASSPYMRFGDTVKIEVLDDQGASVFGAIEQRVVKAP